jgi:hypothetical protein
VRFKRLLYVLIVIIDKAIYGNIPFHVQKSDSSSPGAISIWGVCIYAAVKSPLGDLGVKANSNY